MKTISGCLTLSLTLSIHIVLLDRLLVRVHTSIFNIQLLLVELVGSYNLSFAMCVSIKNVTYLITFHNASIMQ